MKHTIACAILSICFATTVFSQTKSSEIITENGTKYYIHTVQAKETFYGLSKLYGVSIDDIQHSNDNLKSLSIGQQIRIPVVTPTENPQYKDGEIIVKNGKSFVVHIVKPGETLYSLARTYGTSAGQILIENPSINNSQITIGQQLFIPFSGTVAPSTTNAPQKDANNPSGTIVNGDAYNTNQNKPNQNTYTEQSYKPSYSEPPTHFSTVKYSVGSETSLLKLSEKISVPVEVIRDYNHYIPDPIPADYEITLPANAVYYPKQFIFCSSAGTTLSDIALTYQVSSAELLHYNPYGIAHFNEGVLIQIPITRYNIELARKQIRERSYIYHTVQPGETEYSIARMYNTTDTVLIANNIHVDFVTLVSGTILRIPYQENYYEYIEMPNEGRKYLPNGTEIIHPEVNVTLLLPFFLQKNAMNPDEGIINKPKEIYEHTYQFLEYYEGMLIALDSIKKLGISVTLNVIESNNDSATTNISKIQTNTNFIIGPVFPKTFPAAAGFAKRHAIPIISPLSTEETNSLNPFVIQMNTPQKYRFMAMVDYIIEHNENCHVCILYNSETLEKKNSTQCKAAFNAQKSKLDAKHITFEEMFFPNSGSAGLDRAMSKKEKTIFIVLSRQQAFANNIVTKIYQASKTHSVELWGMPQWEHYENLELDFLYDLNFKLVTSGEINYNSPRVNKFITTYRERYNTEPTKFSFQGFDQTLFFIKHYATSSNFIIELQSIENEDGLHDSFNFVKKDGSSVNTTAFIVEYDKNTYKRNATRRITTEEER